MKIHKKNNGVKYFEITVPKRTFELREWCDKDHLIFLAVGRLFEEYVVGEEGGIEKLQRKIAWGKEEMKDPEADEWTIVYWTNHLPVIEEVIKLYKFWIALPKFNKKIEDKYLTGPDTDKWFYWEDKLFKLEDQFMKRVIDIRGTMWT